MTKSKYRAGAFFDADGTLVQGILIQGFASYLKEKEIILPVNERDIRRVLGLQVKIRGYYQSSEEAKEDFEEFARSLLEVYGKSLTGKSARQIEIEAGKFINNSRKRTDYPYTKKLVNLVRERNYEPVIVSASASELVRAYATRLGIEHVLSTEYEENSGIRTDRVRKSAAKARNKKELVENFAREHKINLDISAGFGDSLLDVEFLRTVKNRFAIQPTDSLKRIADDEGWTVCDKANEVLTIVRRELPNWN